MPEPRRLALIGCSKSKLSTPARARDLYTGSLFTKSLRYAELTCDATAILSAKYGLVQLDDVIHPYNAKITDMPIGHRRAWAWLVKAALEHAFPFPHWTYVYLAGSLYIEGLPKGDTPMQNLRNGKRLRWLTARLESHRE